MLTEQETLKRTYEYNVEHGYPLYCAYKCKCAVCGTVFYSKLPSGKYCSYRCRNDGYIMARRQRHEQALEKTCRICGKHFKAKRVDALYCSNACKQKAYRKGVTDVSFANISTT